MVIFYDLSQNLLISGYDSTCCYKKGDFLLLFVPFIAVIQFEIQFCNAFMNLRFDPCRTQISILAVGENGNYFLLHFREYSTGDCKIVR